MTATTLTAGLVYSNRAERIGADKYLVQVGANVHSLDLADGSCSCSQAHGRGTSGGAQSSCWAIVAATIHQARHNVAQFRKSEISGKTDKTDIRG